MGQLFNYWHNARHHGIDAMGRILLLAFLVSGIVYGQSQPSSEKIKKDVYSVQSAVDDAVGAAIPGWGVLQKARGAYLEGYGIVVTMEVALDSPLECLRSHDSAGIADELGPLSPDQLGGPAEPVRGIALVVRMLRRLDVVEELAIDDGLPRRRDRRDQAAGLAGVGVRHPLEPLPLPQRTDRLDGRGGDPVKEGRLIEQRMTDPAIAPIEQHERLRLFSFPADVAGMEVAVNERVG